MSYRAGDIFMRLGGDVINPATVLPASLPLDLCGESVRARLCMLTDHRNKDLALRPDLTLPVALAEIEARKAGTITGQSVHQYAARAFRQPAISGEPMEFMQVGFERFGALETTSVDAETYELVSHEAEAAGVKHGQGRFGDLGILPAFIDALDLSPTVNAGLRRAFREQGGVSAYLERANRPRDGLVRRLAGLDRISVETEVAAAMKAGKIRHFGNRTMDEVVVRLMEQAVDAQNGDVPTKAGEVLSAVLEVKGAPQAAVDRLAFISREAGLTGVEDALEGLVLRMDMIGKAAPRFLEGAIFGASFGRRFTYYDGFVFEIAEVGERSARPFGAGGRYDQLLSDLSGGEISATAIGGVVRPDRLALAAGGSIA